MGSAGGTGGLFTSTTPYGYLHSIGLWCVQHIDLRDFTQIFRDFGGDPIAIRSSALSTFD